MDGSMLVNDYPATAPDTSALTRIMGFSLFASLLEGFVGGRDGGGGVNAAMMSSVRLLILGTLVEAGRRFFRWAVERFKLFQYSITAQFQEGDPAYEWLILLLTEEKVWTRARQFRVNATNSTRKWTVNVANADNMTVSKDANAEYVPTYDEAQLFKWRGYWVEIRRSLSSRYQLTTMLFVTLYTRDMSALAALVDDAKERYTKKSKPHVIVHTIDQVRHVRLTSMSFNPNGVWGNSKSKQRRPLSSIILQEGVIQSLVEDAREFLRTEDWYSKAGIPHRRGCLLHGPPGTGKSSTIYAVAGELGLEIYSLSLASGFIDDSFLQRAVAAIPKQAIFLIEDIDCAFPSREDQDEDSIPMLGGAFPPHLMTGGQAGRQQRSPITLSGLLNVLDGVGSEEGKIFFATTNYIDRLDSALLRPGRIDKKIQYRLATKAQAAALFLRFYPESYTTLLCEKSAELDTSGFSSEKISSKRLTPAEKDAAIAVLAEKFSEHVPEHEFSTAELQGFLLSCKQEPERAVSEIAAWVVAEREEREAKRVREEGRAAKKKEKNEIREAKNLQGSLLRLGSMGAFGSDGPGGSSAVPGVMGSPETKLTISADPIRGPETAILNGAHTNGITPNGSMPPTAVDAIIGEFVLPPETSSAMAISPSKALEVEVAA